MTEQKTAIEKMIEPSGLSGEMAGKSEEGDGSTGGTNDTLGMYINNDGDLIARMAEVNFGRVVGKSAYQYAVDGGYTGTEVEFQTEMNLLPETREKVADVEDKLTKLVDLNPGVPCSVLGMIANDSKTSVAEHNYTTLLTALQSGSTVLVDDAYVLKSPYSISTDINLYTTENIRITGYNKNKSRLTLLGGNYFRITGSADINNISIVTPKDSKIISFLITANSPFNIKNIQYTNCYFSGDLRVLSTSVPSNNDFINNECIVQNLLITNNEFYDMSTSSSSPAMFVLNNTQVEYCEISNNKVHDFAFVFYSNEITNEQIPEVYDWLMEHSKLLVIENNVVRNSLDFDPFARNPASAPAYFCFALVELHTVRCTGNIFEGFMVHNKAGLPVYDNYFSVRHLVYEGNTYKNIVNFTDSKSEYIDLMKSKQGGITRVYRKNHFIMEASLADYFGKDRFSLRKSIDSYQEWVQDVVITDNLFNLYSLCFRFDKKTINYMFSNNVVVADVFDGKTVQQALLSALEYPDDQEHTIERQLVFSNNNIVFKGPAVGSAVGGAVFSLVYNSGGNGSNVTYVFENNYIKGCNLHYVFRDGRKDVAVRDDPCAASLHINNNTILAPWSETSVICANKIGVTNLAGNVFDVGRRGVSGSVNAYPLRLFQDIPRELDPPVPPVPLKYLPTCLNLNMRFKYTSDQILRLIPLSSVYQYNYTVTMVIKVLGQTRYREFYTAFMIKNDGSNSVLECNGRDITSGDSAYSPKAYVLDGSAGVVYGNFYIEQTNIKGDSTINVNVSNSSSGLGDKWIMLSVPTDNKFNNDTIDITMSIVPT